MEDILDSLTSGPKASALLTPEEEDSNINYWESTDIKPLAIDPEKFIEHPSKTFMIITPYRVTIPESSKEVLFKLARALFAKGYTFRNIGGSEDNFAKAVCELPDAKVETYIPWKKFNEEATNVVLKKPTPKAYRMLFGNNKFAPKLKPAIRAINARNINALLGKDVNDPTTMLLTYTANGAEVLKKGLDYKQMGDLPNYLFLSSKANIPVFNVQNEDALRRFKELVLSKET